MTEKKESRRDLPDGYIRLCAQKDIRNDGHGYFAESRPTASAKPKLATGIMLNQVVVV